MASVMVAAMEYLPTGFRFQPTDEELLGHYLWRKNLGLEGPECVIPEVDLCRWEPEELQAKFSESSIVQSKDLECWFFYEHKPGQMQGRSTGGGYWKKTGQTSDIKSRNGTRQIIGSKKILTFYRGNRSSSTKTNWVMHEYHLDSNALDGLFSGDRKNYVVCLIKFNTDCELDEPMTVEITNILEAEADDGFMLEVLADTDGPLNVCEMLTSPTRTEDLFTSPNNFALLPASDNLDNAIFETLWTKQELVVIVENRQLKTEVESLHGFVPLDKEKYIVEDNSTKSSASSLQ